MRRLFCVLALVSGEAFAQVYPAKSIQWVVPTPPGGAYDLLTRAIAPTMSAALGQPLVVDNRPGAASIPAMSLVARAAPDGYTVITSGNTALVFNRYIHSKLPYDSQRDFTPVGMIARLPLALYAHESVPATSLKELFAHAKAHPGKLNYGSAGAGQTFHLAMEMLNQHAGVEMVHIPYKGTAPALQDFFAGRLQLMFYPPTTQMLAQVKAGRVRPLAAMTDQRFRDMPDVPTFAEAGVRDFDVAGWACLMAPAGTPRAAVERLSRELARAIAAPEVAGLFHKLNAIPSTGTPEQLAKLIARDMDAWGPLITKLGVKAN